MLPTSEPPPPHPASFNTQRRPEMVDTKKWVEDHPGHNPHHSESDESVSDHAPKEKKPATKPPLRRSSHEKPRGGKQNFVDRARKGTASKLARRSPKPAPVPKCDVGMLKSPTSLVPPPPLPASIHPSAASGSVPAVASVLVSQSDEVVASVLDDEDMSCVDAVACNILLPLNSIWDCDMMNKIPGEVSTWRCSWCGKEFNPFHGTRAMAHVLKQRGANITVCTAEIRPAEYRRYVDLHARGVSRKKANKRARESNYIATEHKLAVGLHGSVHAAAMADARRLNDNVFDTDAQSTMSSVSRANSPPRTTSSKASTRGQMSINSAFQNMPVQRIRQQTDIRVSNNAQFELAIADCFFTNNWSDNSIMSPSFARLVKLARLTTNDFIIPNRNKLGGPLLLLSYTATNEVNATTQLRAASTWGLSFMGDGATVLKMPLINVLAMCGDSPPIVVAVNDCTEHMATGGKKDAPYIMKVFDDAVVKYDPEKVHTDLFFVDGASNVQKGGAILCEMYPRAECYHAGEHVMALFFSDIANLRAIKVWNLLVSPI